MNKRSGIRLYIKKYKQRYYQKHKTLYLSRVYKKRQEQTNRIKSLKAAVQARWMRNTNQLIRNYL